MTSTKQVLPTTPEGWSDLATSIYRKFIGMGLPLGMNVHSFRLNPQGYTECGKFLQVQAGCVLEGPGHAEIRFIDAARDNKLLARVVFGIPVQGEPTPFKVEVSA